MSKLSKKLKNGKKKLQKESIFPVDTYKNQKPEVLKGSYPSNFVDLMITETIQEITKDLEEYENNDK